MSRIDRPVDEQRRRAGDLARRRPAAYIARDAPQHLIAYLIGVEPIEVELRAGPWG
jgi:hypothetical protein